MIQLPTVTLVIYEAKAFEMASLVIKELTSQIQFEDFFGCFDPRPLDKNEGQKWLWETMPKSINTTHVLNVEWDSGINDLSMWTDEFLDYDFIGAPWPWHEENQRVGNGGFSLISTELLMRLTDGDYPYLFPWDDTLCRTYRPLLEREGFKWAPEEVANRFSLEWGPLRRSFGYHDVRNWPRIYSSKDLFSRIKMGKEYETSKDAWKQMLEAIKQGM